MSEGFKRATVYTIPPDVSFLKTLAENILDGSLLPEGYDLHDPFALGDVTIYLPTQRAVQRLKSCLLDLSGKPSLIMPDIRALGDVDDDEVFFNPYLSKGLASLPPAISPIKRQLILTRMISAWGRALDHAIGDDLLLFPSSAADAAWLANDLAELMDRVTTEEVSWRALHQIVPDDYAAFWQRSLDFLKIASEQWPAVLKEYGMMDAAARRDAGLERECARFEQLNGPVIAAGSTGTLPSTAKLLARVARHPMGCVVLPGFDVGMDEEVISTLFATSDQQDDVVSHPQFGLTKLLRDFIKIKPDEVDEIGQRSEPLAMRTNLLRDAMLPADMTDRWLNLTKHYAPEKLKAAFENVAILDARNDGEEAMAIAFAIREFLEDGEKSSALVTPDRALARRVALELGRFGMDVDDSAGRPLAKTPPAVLAELIVDVVHSDFDPVSVLSLLKHPLVTFGLDGGDVRRAARLIDLAVLRGPRIRGGFHDILVVVERLFRDINGVSASGSDRKDDDDRPFKHIHPNVEALAKEDWVLGREVLKRAGDAFSIFLSLYGEDVTSLSELLRAHQRVYRAVTSNPDLDETPSGIAVYQIFDEANDENVRNFNVSPNDYIALFRALLGTRTVRERTRSDPRVMILGALEARLMDVDFIVLAGLDEGSWPQQTNTDAFMSRGMRAAMGLEAPERRIGLAAHDVVQAFGTRQVLLTRAAKRGGSPTVRSRWLQRLTALLGKDLSTELHDRGSKFANYVRALDRVSGAGAKPAERPNPTPPVAARPNRLSVTRVETWVRDPYALYAEFILKLKVLDPLGNLPDFATRGTIVHEALDRFISDWDGEFGSNAKAQLTKIGEEIFAKHMADFPDQQALWWPRFERITRAYINWEAQRDERVKRRHSETSAAFAFPVDGEIFKLVCKADRIDELVDGTLALIDFKTGQPPSAKTVKSGLAAQLALEVTMLQNGAFDHLGAFSSRTVTELGWLKLNGTSDHVDISSALVRPKKGEEEDTPDDLGELAQKQLQAMVRAYRKPAQGYLSRPRPDFKSTYQSPYDHLARVREWELGDEGGGE